MERHSYTRSKRVHAWLEETSESRQEATHSVKRRRILGEVSENIIPSSRDKVGAKVKPRYMDADSSALPDDATPRAERITAPSAVENAVGRVLFQYTNEPTAPSYLSGPNDIAATDESTESSTGTSTSRKRKRPSSPVKRMAALRNADYGVRTSFIVRWRDLPLPLQSLAKDMRDCNWCAGLIAPEDSIRLFDHIAEGEEDDARLVASQRASIGSSPDIDFARRIIRNTTMNIQLSRSEPAWNCNVHASLLEQSLDRSVHAESLRLENITTAAIEPSTLLPSMTTIERSPSKKADFALTLVLPDETEKRLVRASITSLNQTLYEPLRYSPIAVNFETKLPGEAWDAAQLQLSTWSLAQVAQLRQLLGKAGNPSGQVPPLPLVVVQGKTWTFLYLEVCDSHAKLWESIQIGSTDSPRGVYQVVTGIQKLAQWAETVYRPWFQANILDCLLRTVT